jgi:AraC-like DNA-binding protein
MVTDAVAKAGAPSERIVERAGLPMWQLHPDDTMIPGSHFFGILDAAARALGDETLGVFVAEQVPLNSLGSIGQKICDADTVYDSITTALKLVSKFQSSSRFWITENEKEFWWFRQTTQVFEHGTEQSEIQTVRYMIDAVRANAGRSWTPLKICFEAAPISGLQTIEAFAGSEIYYGQPAGGFAIPKSHLARQSSFNLPIMNDTLLDKPPSQNFVGSLRQILQSFILENDLEIESVAEAAGLHVRTLQRRLAMEDLNFKRLVNHARYQASLELINDPGIRFIEIAQHLGYSDQAHFTRAFHRWAGVSPSEYRRFYLSGNDQFQ